jgi:hypothetical protein
MMERISAAADIITLIYQQDKSDKANCRTSFALLSKRVLFFLKSKKRHKKQVLIAIISAPADIITLIYQPDKSDRANFKTTWPHFQIGFK